MPPLASDIAGVDDLDFALTTVSGPTALAQAILRRFRTPRGALLGAPNYGFDLCGLIGSEFPTSIVEQRMLEQVLAEEEVEDARVAVTFDARTGVLNATVRVVAGDGPFTLTITADQVNVTALLNGSPLLQAA